MVSVLPAGAWPVYPKSPTRIVAPCVSGCLHPLHQTWPQLAMRPATDQRADVLERDAGFGKINEYGRIGERFQR